MIMTTIVTHVLLWVMRHAGPMNTQALCIQLFKDEQVVQQQTLHVKTSMLTSVSQRELYTQAVQQGCFLCNLSGQLPVQRST